MTRNIKIKSKEDGLFAINGYKTHHQSVVFTNGCFDILHLGHLQYLKEAKRLGDRLVVGLNSDKSIKKLKGKNRPINDEFYRSEMLAALEVIDLVIIFDEKSSKKLTLEVNPDIYVKGGDYVKEELSVYGKVKRVEIIPFEYDYSTTKIISYIREEIIL